VLRNVGILVGFLGAGIVVFGVIHGAQGYEPEASLFLIGFLFIGVGFLSYKSRR
jgi:hypothetical protein